MQVKIGSLPACQDCMKPWPLMSPGLHAQVLFLSSAAVDVSPPLLISYGGSFLCCRIPNTDLENEIE